MKSYRKQEMTTGMWHGQEYGNAKAQEQTGKLIMALLWVTALLITGVALIAMVY